MWEEGVTEWCSLYSFFREFGATRMSVFSRDQVAIFSSVVIPLMHTSMSVAQWLIRSTREVFTSLTYGTNPFSTFLMG